MFSCDLYSSVAPGLCISPLTSAKACEKSNRRLWKKTCVSTGVRKPGNTCVTDRHNMTKVVLNLNTTNQLWLSR